MLLVLKYSPCENHQGGLLKPGASGSAVLEWACGCASLASFQAMLELLGQGRTLRTPRHTHIWLCGRLQFRTTPAEASVEGLGPAHPDCGLWDTVSWNRGLHGTQLETTATGLPLGG